jgi:Ca2+ transporting ATPase
MPTRPSRFERSPVCIIAVHLSVPFCSPLSQQRLKESEARDAVVIRNGETKHIPAKELVPGDIIVVDIGVKVPADSRLLNLTTPVLMAEEAMLTGEAEPPIKFVESIGKKDENKEAVNQDKRNILFSVCLLFGLFVTLSLFSYSLPSFSFLKGTLVVRGKGTACVVGIGAETEMGKIANALNEEDDKTPLQKKLDEFGEQLSKVIGIICVVVWVINYKHFADPEHGSWIKGAIYYFKIAVALAVAAIPEGLPAVVTTCLALGTYKMAKKNAVVRKLPSVETLGCTTVICSDKTGTLTTNKMTIQKVLVVDSAKKDDISLVEYNVEGDSFSPIGAIRQGEAKVCEHPACIDPALATIGKISALCNESSIFHEEKKEHKSRDSAFRCTGAPTEAAMLVLSEKIGVPDLTQNQVNFANRDPNQRCVAARKHWDGLFQKLHVLEFSRERKSMSVVVKGADGKTVLMCKGAPESVLRRCDFVAPGRGEPQRLTDAMRASIEKSILAYAAQGLRVTLLPTLTSRASKPLKRLKAV